MLTLSGLRSRLRLIGKALTAPFEVLYTKPRSATGLFDFLEPLLAELPAIPQDLRAMRLPDDPDAEIVESSELEVARTIYVVSRLLRARRLVEVGVFRGATSRFLARALRDNGGGVLHLVDWSREALAEAEGALEPLLHVSIQRHLGRSTDSAILEAVPPTCDLVYLDAQHSESGVRAELAAWLSKVRRAGVVAVHDSIGIDGVCRAVHAYADEYPILTVATGRGAGLSLIRVETVAGAATRTRGFNRGTVKLTLNEPVLPPMRR